MIGLFRDPNVSTTPTDNCVGHLENRPVSTPMEGRRRLEVGSLLKTGTPGQERGRLVAICGGCSSAADLLPLRGASDVAKSFVRGGGQQTRL